MKLEQRIEKYLKENRKRKIHQDEISKFFNLTRGGSTIHLQRLGWERTGDGYWLNPPLFTKAKKERDEKLKRVLSEV
jgi:hypothetical protein